MAKILLVCDQVTPTSWELAQALKSQQHQVIFLTGREQTVENTNGIDFMAFFKNWNAMEVARLLPTLVSMQPQIVHFVLESDRVTAAHLGLWGFAKARRSIVFTLTFLHVEKGLSRGQWVRYLVQQSDIVTCPSIDSLALLRGINIKTIRQGRAVLPPVLSFQEATSVPSDQDLEVEELLSGEPYLVRPFSQNHFDPQAPFFIELLQAMKIHVVVLLGSQDHWNLRERKQFQAWLQSEGLETRWLLTGHHSIEDAGHLIKNAEAIWLSNLDLSPIELTDYFLKAIDTTSTLILDSSQELLHAPLWRNGQNCWIQDQPAAQFFADKSLKLAYQLDRHSMERKSLVDAPLNELNRLYNKALSQKAIL